jgi:hypothetical protein
MPTQPTSTRNRFLIGAGIAAGLLLAVFGVVQWNNYEGSLKVVDSCGNTEASLSKETNLLQSCATVSGQVIQAIAMPNGDLDVQLQLSRDSAYARNTANQGLQNGGLLVVLPCGTATAVPTAYFETCAAFRNVDITPGYHTPLTYTGNLVINQKFGWVEMQPAGELPGAAS